MGCVVEVGKCTTMCSYLQHPLLLFYLVQARLSSENASRVAAESNAATSAAALSALQSTHEAAMSDARSRLQRLEQRCEAILRAHDAEVAQLRSDAAAEAGGLRGVVVELEGALHDSRTASGRALEHLERELARVAGAAERLEEDRAR